MKNNISNTWNGTTYCIKTKDGTFVVINYKKLEHNKSKLIVFESDKRGVVIDFGNPIFEKIYSNFDEKYLKDMIKKYEYVNNPQKKKSKKKKEKVDYHDDKKIINNLSKQIKEEEDKNILNEVLKNKKEDKNEVQRQ